MTYPTKLNLSVFAAAAALLCGAAQVYASGDVNIEDAGTNQISLYSDRALVTQTFVTDPDSNGTFAISGLQQRWAKQMQLGYTVGKKKYLPVSTFWRNGQLNKDWIYRAMVGKSVELIGGGLNVAVPGTMLSYQDGFALVQGNNNRQYVVNCNEPQGIQIVSREELFRAKDFQSGISTSFDPTVSDGTLSLRFITPELSYHSSYRMTVSDNNLANFGLTVQVINRSDIDFDHADVQLVAADLPVHFTSGVMLASARQSDMEMDEMSSERVGETMVVPLPDISSIPARSTQQLTLFQRHGVELTSEYHLNFYGRSYSARSSVVERPQHYYRFKAAQDMPSGRVTILQKTSSGKALISGESQIDRMTEGEMIQIATGEAFAVGVDRQRLSQNQTSDSLQSRWKITISNSKAEPVTIKIRDRDRGIRQIRDVKGARAVDATTAEVTVPAGSSKDVQLTSVYNK